MPRTVPGKAWQAFRAWQLERHLRKDEILAPLPRPRAPPGQPPRRRHGRRRGVVGQRPADLSADEAATIVGVLPAPNRFDPRRHPVAARSRRDVVLTAMRDEGFLDDDACRAAQARPVVVAPDPFPSAAPHVALRAATAARCSIRWCSVPVERMAAAVPPPDGDRDRRGRRRHGGRHGARRRARAARRRRRRERPPAQRGLDAEAVPLRARARPRARRPRHAGARPPLGVAGVVADQLRPGLRRAGPRIGRARRVAQPARRAARGGSAARRVRDAARALRLHARARARRSARRRPRARHRRRDAARTRRGGDGARGRRQLRPLRFAVDGAARAGPGTRVTSAGAAALVAQVLATPGRTRPAGAPPGRRRVEDGHVVGASRRVGRRLHDARRGRRVAGAPRRRRRRRARRGAAAVPPSSTCSPSPIPPTFPARPRTREPRTPIRDAQATVAPPADRRASSRSRSARRRASRRRPRVRRAPHRPPAGRRRAPRALRRPRPRRRSTARPATCGAIDAARATRSSRRDVAVVPAGGVGRVAPAGWARGRRAAAARGLVPRPARPRGRRTVARRPRAGARFEARADGRASVPSSRSPPIRRPCGSRSTASRAVRRSAGPPSPSTVRDRRATRWS